MKPISNVALSIAPSATMAIDAMAKQMKADGINVIGFGAGEPDFDTPEHIKQAGIAAINNNKHVTPLRRVHWC
jgi:aspartate aminotransferase